MRLGFDARGLVGSVTSPLGRRWTIESGADGEPRRLTSPSDSRLTFAYGADGQVAGVTRGVPGDERLVAGLDHDEAGRVVRTRYADRTQSGTAYHHAGADGVCDPLGRAPRFQCAQWRQRPVAITHPDGRRGYSVDHFPCGWEGDFPSGTRVIY